MKCHELAPLRQALVGLLLVFASGAGAQTANPVSANIGDRPHIGGEPDEVSVLLGLVDIVDVDDRAQVFTIDAYVEIGWRDPRLAVDASAGTDGETRVFDIEDIWTPGLLVINDRGLDRLLPETATVDRQGNVMMRQRIAGPLAAHLDLHKFPFDTQRLTIEVVSYRYSPEELVFSAASEMVADVDALAGEGWTFSAMDPEASTYRLRDEGAGRPQLTFALSAQRDPGYYILSLAVPMMLVLFLSWTVHWLSPTLVAQRIGMASATVFSFIAFGVSFRLTLPRIAYLTTADRFVLYSTLLVLASLAVTILTTRLIGQSREAAAIRITRAARIAFPFICLGIVVLSLAG